MLGKRGEDRTASLDSTLAILQRAFRIWYIVLSMSEFLRWRIRRIDGLLISEELACTPSTAHSTHGGLQLSRFPPLRQRCLLPCAMLLPWIKPCEWFASRRLIPGQGGVVTFSSCGEECEARSGDEVYRAPRS
jgi:hypothetical protein